jgi:GrxC family glutaredoxin
MAFQGQVLLFTITGCPYCSRARKVISDHQVPFVEVNLDRYPERRHEMQERTGRRTVPQIFFNDKHIGGFDDLKKLYDNGSLEDELKTVAETEVPSDAPQPPSNGHEPETDSGDELLPSQRAKLAGAAGSTDDCLDCTPDELAALVREIQDSSLVKTHTYHLRGYKNTFVARNFVSWLVENKGLATRTDALKLGLELQRKHFIHHVTFDHQFKDEWLFFRLLGDGHMRALNAKLSYACIPRPANEVADDLRRYILEIYADHLSPDGYSVDYRGISSSAKFETYVRATAELKRVDITNLTRDEKIAFFVNIYNALVIHGFVVQGPPNNHLKRYRYFNSTSYIIGGRCYSLNDIENGVLRGNRKPIATFKRPFSSSDPRLKVALDEVEPKVHFALVCGAKSCPPIRTYTPADIDEELKLVTEAYFESDSCMVDLARKEISLSMVLKWYRDDFGSNNHEVLCWICGHMAPGDKKTALTSLLDQRNYRVKFQKYNWDVNSH